MPTYTNGGTVPKDYAGIRFEPGVAVESNIYIPTASLPTGVTQTAATPYFDEALQTSVVSSSSTVTVDATIIQNYLVKVYCDTGNVVIQLNNAAANSISLGAGDSYSVYCSERTVDNIIFTISSGTAAVNILKA